jgi:soluble lytic murein transglycosylase-like protein
MNAVSLLSHIGVRKRISNKLLAAFLLLGGVSAIAQTAPTTIADRMQASAKRQILSVARMKTWPAEASISRQKKSISKQAATDSAGDFFALPQRTVSPGAIEPPCAVLPPAEVDELVTQAGAASSVPPDLLRSVMKQESGFYPCAVSSKGAMGLMQLMPPTANGLGVGNAFDPRENVNAGARYLKQLMDLYKGDVTLALGAYNAGPGRVDASQGIPEIPETTDYVNRILSVFQSPKKSPAPVESAVDQPLCDTCR